MCKKGFNVILRDFNGYKLIKRDSRDFKIFYGIFGILRDFKRF